MFSVIIMLFVCLDDYRRKSFHLSCNLSPSELETVLFKCTVYVLVPYSVGLC
jgi:hypothetical protein